MARVALLQDTMVEYMGLMCISAVLKQAGHTVDVFFDDQRDEDKFLREVAEFAPDIVGFSILSPSIGWALRLAKRIKASAPHVITVMGNVHIITTPETIEEEGVDIVCLGEGEECMKELCAAVDQGEDYSRIAGFWVKTPDGIVKNAQREDLVVMDEQPYHDREMYNKYFYFRSSNYLRVYTGRGCPFRCSFCTNTVLSNIYGGNRYVRKRSPLKAIEEIEATIRQHPRTVKFIFFIDEVFWVKNDWVREFLPLYKERIGLPFFANFRFGGIEEEDVKLMVDAGLATIYVATETADEDQRRKLLNKPVKDEQIMKVAGWMNKYKVWFASSAFFGLPGDTFDDHIRRLAWFRRENPSYLWGTFFQPYPGIPLTKQMEEIKDMMPQGKDFTTNHAMYLNLPDGDRLANLKKVYFIMMKFPILERPLAWLCSYNIPFFFDFLFTLHFAYYIYHAERLNPYQALVHFVTAGQNPLHTKRPTPLRTSGHPYSIPWKKHMTAAQEARTAE
ncbi:MAG: radical SAM protein [Candidatus Hydrogenedens sp.]|nr:radical SAM protein [Candidatus Hydrogenedens sp.]